MDTRGWNRRSGRVVDWQQWQPSAEIHFRSHSTAAHSKWSILQNSIQHRSDLECASVYVHCDDSPFSTCGQHIRDLAKVHRRTVYFVINKINIANGKFFGGWSRIFCVFSLFSLSLSLSMKSFAFEPQLSAADCGRWTRCYSCIDRIIVFQIFK